MKNIITCLIIATALFYGCKKSGNNTPAPSAKTQWTFSGNTYYGVTTVFDPDSLEESLTSTDSLGNQIYLIFPTRPAKNGVYNAVLANLPLPSDLAPNQCMVGALVMNNGDVIYLSTGTGGKVSVTISSGKITAVLSGVGLENLDLPQDAPTLSGTLHEQ